MPLNVKNRYGLLAKGMGGYGTGWVDTERDGWILRGMSG